MPTAKELRARIVMRIINSKHTRRDTIKINVFIILRIPVLVWRTRGVTDFPRKAQALCNTSPRAFYDHRT